MLDVHAGGDELRAFLGESPQQSFTAFVNERDIIKVDNAGSVVLACVRPLPRCLQLADPRSDQAPLHDPPSFCWRLRHGDLQHVYLSSLPSHGASSLIAVRSSDNVKCNTSARTRRVWATTELLDLL